MFPRLVKIYIFPKLTALINNHIIKIVFSDRMKKAKETILMALKVDSSKTHKC